MDNTPYASRLRFLDADDVDDSVIDYDGLDVKGPDGDNIGNVDGFIVDADAGRAYYVVVDSGGWFSSRHFLLPVGHVRLDTEDRALKTDVARAALTRYPEFDRDRFRDFTDEDMRAFETRTSAACCPDEALDDVSVPGYAYGTRRHYDQPDWWTSVASKESFRPVETGTATADRPIGVRDYYNEEHAVARERDRDDVVRDRDITRDRDLRDDSPHMEGRAQPGDVLGLETGGETTHIGETADDEDKRRRDSMKTED